LATGLENIAAPVALDVTAANWWGAVEGPVDFIYCCNMIHISPWATTPGLMSGAGALLDDDGKLALYGPFTRDGMHTAPSNEEFDRSLKSRDPDWGVRDIKDVCHEAASAGLDIVGEIEMPANNLLLMFEKGAK